MAIFNVPYLVGNTFNRDHVQWPTILRNEIDDVHPGLTDDEKDAIWPVDVTLQQILSLCWRVRKWDFSGSVAVSVGTSYPNPPAPDIVNNASGTATVDATEIVNILNGVEATRERDLVGRVWDDTTNALTRFYKNLVSDGLSFVEGNVPVSDWTTTSSISGDDSGFLSAEFQALSDYHLFDEDTEQFGPPFNGPGVLIAGSSSDLIASARFFRNPDTVLSGPTPTLLKFPIVMTVIPGIAPSFNVPMELSWRFSGEPPGGTTSGTASGSFTLQATEFWPYSNTLGQSVYDDGSGEQIADPFA